MTTKVKKGLIGFFDILGYKSLLDNNEITYLIHIIEKLLKDVKELPNSAIKAFGLESTNHIETVKQIKTLIFSDTILISLECEKESEAYKTELLIFLLYSSYLLKYSFKEGLPLRGSIDYGEHVIIQNTFAGKPIINAYEAEKTINLSACSILESVNVKILEVHKNDLYFNYNTPLKKGDKNLNLMNFLIAEGDNDNYELDKIIDLRQFVLNSFLKHNKTYGEQVYIKALNTEMFLRFCKSKAN
ncbi:MAG: hypothetical protein PF638_12925 [Candidatus Delongbacteria bacterium]|jgi:hypothetical protein|nr:hypothetical protein [Candidatus Delongbacteria bacterium]